MRKTLHIRVEQKEVVIAGTVGSMVVYGVNEDLQDEGRFFLSLEASLYEPKVVHGDREVLIHLRREGLYLILIPVSGPDVGFTITVTPNAKG